MSIIDKLKSLKRYDAALFYDSIELNEHDDGSLVKWEDLEKLLKLTNGHE